MNKELKIKWISALRSGNYEQIRGALKKDAVVSEGIDVGHCCLGVLICVSGQYRGPQLSGAGHGTDYNFLDCAIGATARYDLMNMNDQERKPFAEIGDYVEANL